MINILQIMLPIPEYPGYTFLTVINKGSIVPYYLNEEKEWSLTVLSISLVSQREALEESYSIAMAAKVIPKAIVVINPNNPTGSVLSRKAIEDVP